jgi:lipopolysaccharide export system protein LptA
VTSRPGCRALGLTLAGLALLAPAAARGQGGEPQRCVLQFESSSGARSTLNKLPSGQYNAYQGGGVTYSCVGQNNTLKADSAEYYGDLGVLYLIGNVHYTEPRAKVDSRRMTYWKNEERLLAEGDVVSTLPSGTTLRGPRAEYYRAVPNVRANTRLIANGRPTISLVQIDSTGKKQPPVDIKADRVTVDADSLVYAGGSVDITRPDLHAMGDSAFMDKGTELARLMRGPVIEGKSERPFKLSGTTIDVYSRQRQLERVISLGNANAISQDLDLRADTIDLRVTANKLERAYAWGANGARAISPTQLITADSLDVRLPGQRIRQVFAIRHALAQSDPDSTKIRVKERDWLRGDTIVAAFDSVFAPGDTAAKPQLVQLVARGGAQSFYHIAVAGSPIDKPAINYVRGRAITVALANRQVQRVTVTEKASGVYVEPVVARAPAAASGDSSTVRKQQP